MRPAHLVITPFNLPVHGSPGIDPDWLRHRFELFERFCLPSVRAQTNQEFVWYVLADPRTPSPFRERLEAYGGWSAFRPCWVESVEASLSFRTEYDIGGADVVITTTLDNDDAIAKDFVDRVRNDARTHGPGFLNYPQGYRYAVRDKKLYRHRVRSNPFLTLVEHGPSPKGIRSYGPHDHIERKHAIRNIESEPMWIQVVHGRNVAATGVWGCRRVPVGELEERFPDLEVPAGHDGRVSIAAENLRRSGEALAIRALGPETRTRLRRLLRF